MENSVHAIIMGFSMLVFVIGLTVAVNMFSQVTTTSEVLLYYADKTNYYDNIEEIDAEGNRLNSTERTVDVDTIILTIYRYYKENFCVKICGADGTLNQIFDVNIEGEVRQAAATIESKRTSKQKALVSTYNDDDKEIYLFEAPWIGSTDDGIKTRIDYYVNGKAGYINNTYVDYTPDSSNPESNILYYARVNGYRFKETFTSYTYSGETITNDDGEQLVTGNQPQDKIVIQYTLIP